MVFGEATLTLPLLVSDAYHREAWRDRKGLRLNSLFTRARCRRGDRLTQLLLDLDGEPGKPASAAQGSRGGQPVSGACVLVRELERLLQETRRGRKLLVARSRTEGRELLRN